MAQRPKLGPLTPAPLPGVTFLTEYQAGMKGLFDATVFPLTGIAGTANNLAAGLAWDLDAGLIDGMKFSLTWAANNTGPMTLAINGAAPIALVDEAGGAMLAGAARAGTRALIEFIGGSFRVLIGVDASLATQRFFWRFTASGTWAKPPGLSDDAMVFVEAWGGGGGGGGNSGTNPNGNGGGGGGGYSSIRLRLADLPSSVAVSVAAGGLAGSAGGNSTFGIFMTAFGGGAGGASNASFGGGAGGGGGLGGPGGNGANAGGAGAGGAGGGGLLGGGGPSSTHWPEGGAAGGGAAYLGGGGGATGVSGAGGISIRAGDGGAVGSPGLAPAGGGGRNAAGARGEVRVWI